MAQRNNAGAGVTDLTQDDDDDVVGVEINGQARVPVRHPLRAGEHARADAPACSMSYPAHAAGTLEPPLRPRAEKK